MDPRKINDFWQHADVLSVADAVVLLANLNPNSVSLHNDGRLNESTAEVLNQDEIDQLLTIFKALTNAIVGETLFADIKHFTDDGGNEFDINWNTTTVRRQNLTEWLEKIGKPHKFFA